MMNSLNDRFFQGGFCSLLIAALVSFGAFAAQAAVPQVEVAGDTITVTVPEGTVATNASLYLCWGALDAGEVVSAWGHSACLADGTVTATGGVWIVSAAEKGVFAAMRAIVAVTRPYKAVEYVESTTGEAGGGGDGADSTMLSLDSVLAGPKPIADMIQPTKWPNLNVIPSADNRSSQIYTPLKVRIMVYSVL